MIENYIDVYAAQMQRKIIQHRMMSVEYQKVFSQLVGKDKQCHDLQHKVSLSVVQPSVNEAEQNSTYDKSSYPCKMKRTIGAETQSVRYRFTSFPKIFAHYVYPFDYFSLYAIVYIA